MIILLDVGHGGMINNKYTTAPKKMYKFEDGLTIYEGVVNRLIGNKLISFLKEKKITVVPIAFEAEDTSLGERVRRANALEKKFKGQCVFVSIHCNAGEGTGFEVYTSPGETKSDKYATLFMEEFEKEFKDHKMRKDYSDGDPDKESRFYVLVNTSMPAVLLESFFMDTRSDAELLLSDEGQKRIATAYFNAIKQIRDKYYAE